MAVQTVTPTGGTPNPTYTGTNGSFQYVGNPDFRGYVAANSPTLLGLVGNDGNINPDALNSYLSSNPGSSAQSIQGTVNQLYNQYNGFMGPSTNGVTLNTGTASNQPTIDQINGQLGQLDQQQSIGLNNLQNSFQNSLNQLNQQNDLAQNQYNTSQQQNTQNYTNNRNNIITNTNAQMNALQRLLGLNGAGNSSAAYTLVPYAASQYGSQNLNQAQQTYGQNAANLQNSWDSTENTYNTDQDNLNQQLYSGQNSLKSGIAQTRANLLSELGQLQGNTTQYDPQINSLLGQITQLSNQYANPVLNTPSLSFTPATLANYSLGNQTAASQAQNPGQSEVNPTFLNLLQGQNRDQYGNLITG